MAEAFGGPGAPGRWTSAQKSGVGTALDQSAIWFTLSHGILNEVYAPRMDVAAIRDLGMLVVGPDGYFSEEKRDARHTTVMPLAGVPWYHITGTSADGRYQIEKDILTDPLRPVVLQRVVFESQGPDDRLAVLLASHLENYGAGNTAWVGDYKGVPALFARRGGSALALMSSEAFEDTSVGFVGSSDGWQDLRQHGRLAWHFDRATDGNVALTGLLPPSVRGPVLLALAVARSPEEAGHQARAALATGFERIQAAYCEPWQRWQATLLESPRRLWALSATVVRAHESKQVSGALLASLSVPWGFAQGDGDLGGYHLVWSRDMVEAAGGLLAAGDRESVRRALTYLEATQEADGHWLQNMWVEGTPYWSGLQMDETALPILLVDLARREGALSPQDVQRLWPMVSRAARFLIQNGPVTPQDRWEEDGGYTPFTLAAEIAALLAAADLAEEVGESPRAPYLRETADIWNAQVERWLYVRGTPIAAQVGVDGYYVRITPADMDLDPDTPPAVAIKNRAAGFTDRPAEAIVSSDALALVRFGLRAPDDPRVLNTVAVIDALLRQDTPTGPGWRRYNEDGYGEHEDGSPFDGTGVGRLWPLLTGERAHYALMAGHLEEAEQLLTTMESFAGEGGLLPEQVWDQEDIPERELYRGRPSGSAMPLVWAHAEYLKLVRSLKDGRAFDCPPQAAARYLGRTAAPPPVPWRFNHKIRHLPASRTLRVETGAPAVVRWTADDWHTMADTPTEDRGWGVHVADLATAALEPGSTITLTFRWPAADRWEGENFTVRVVAAEPTA